MFLSMKVFDLKIKIAVICMLAVALVFVLLCGSYWLGTQQRGVIVTTSDVPALGIAPAPVDDEPDFSLNLNSASAEELSKLPGIGEKLANAIVDYRTKYGEFRSVWELTAVEGIGQGKLEKIIPYLWIE